MKGRAATPALGLLHIHLDDSAHDGREIDPLEFEADPPVRKMKNVSVLLLRFGLE
jgi:hypothetical protein